jgi:uncharacterized protein YaiE (UPF0345 family)
MLDVNEYFDGKVKSIALQTASLPATVGVMAPGEYTFGTNCKEVMTVISGGLKVKLPAEADWQTFTNGQSFEIEANQQFDVVVAEETAYFCQYWK